MWKYNRNAYFRTNLRTDRLRCRFLIGHDNIKQFIQQNKDTDNGRNPQTDTVLTCTLPLLSLLMQGISSRP